MYVHGELICSLGVDGEATETDKPPSPPVFNTDDFDECGTISISYTNKEKYEILNVDYRLTSSGISASFS